MIHHIEHNLKEAKGYLEALMQSKETLGHIAAAGRRMADTFQEGGKLFSCGNGGSMCDAMHLAEELTGRFRLNRKPIGAMAISDPSHLSCTANDFGYDEVFSRFVAGNCRKGDIFFGISTSGKSENVLRGARTARDMGVFVISLTGKLESPLGELSDINISTPCGRFADRVQELHIKIIHILMELIERQLLGETYNEGKTNV